MQFLILFSDLSSNNITGLAQGAFNGLFGLIELFVFGTSASTSIATLINVSPMQGSQHESNPLASKRLVRIDSVHVADSVCAQDLRMRIDASGAIPAELLKYG